MGYISWKKYRSDGANCQIFLFVRVAVDGETHWGSPEFGLTGVIL